MLAAIRAKFGTFAWRRDWTRWMRNLSDEELKILLEDIVEEQNTPPRFDDDGLDDSYELVVRELEKRGLRVC